MDEVVAIDTKLRLLVQSSGLYIDSDGLLRMKIYALSDEQEVAEELLDIILVLKSHSMLDRIFRMMTGTIVNHLVQMIANEIRGMAGINKCMMFLKYFNKVCTLYRTMPILTILPHFVEKHEAFQAINLNERYAALKSMYKDIIWEFISNLRYELDITMSKIIDLNEATRKIAAMNVSNEITVKDEADPTYLLRKTCQVLLSLPVCSKSCAIYQKIFARPFEKQTKSYSCNSKVYEPAAKVSRKSWTIDFIH